MYLENEEDKNEFKKILRKLKNEEIEKITLSLPDGIHYKIRKDKLFIEKFNIEKYILSEFKRREILQCRDMYRMFKFFNNEEFDIE